MVWIQNCLSIGLCMFHKAAWLSLGFGDGADNSIQCYLEILGIFGNPWDLEFTHRRPMPFKINQLEIWFS